MELEKFQRNSFAMSDFHANITDAPSVEIIASFTSKITPCSYQADYKDSFKIRPLKKKNWDGLYTLLCV